MDISSPAKHSMNRLLVRLRDGCFASPDGGGEEVIWSGEAVIAARSSSCPITSALLIGL
jgi:hypothetical protein